MIKPTRRGLFSLKCCLAKCIYSGINKRKCIFFCSENYRVFARVSDKICAIFEKRITEYLLKDIHRQFLIHWTNERKVALLIVVKNFKYIKPVEKHRFILFRSEFGKDLNWNFNACWHFYSGSAISLYLLQYGHYWLA